MAGPLLFLGLLLGALCLLWPKSATHRRRQSVILAALAIAALASITVAIVFSIASRYFVAGLVLAILSARWWRNVRRERGAAAIPAAAKIGTFAGAIMALVSLNGLLPKEASTNFASTPESSFTPMPTFTMPPPASTPRPGQGHAHAVQRSHTPKPIQEPTPTTSMPWLHATAGQHAFLTDDGAGTNTETVCTTLDEYQDWLSAEKRTGCTSYRRGTSVVIDGLSSIFSFGQKEPIAQIHGLESAFSGYVVLLTLKPSPPAGTVFEFASAPDWPLKIMSSNGPNASEGTDLGSRVKARLLRMDPSFDAADMYVVVVSGSYRGRRGWLSSDETVRPGMSPPIPLAFDNSTPTEAKSPQDRKQAFLASVDESVSGAMIAGNPYKYVGQNVDLHCSVSSIPSDQFFNASCGLRGDGLPAIVLVKYGDVKSLSSGQSVRIIGTVDDPTSGTNAFGGQMMFPTVEAQFME